MDRIFLNTSLKVMAVGFLLWVFSGAVILAQDPVPKINRHFLSCGLVLSDLASSGSGTGSFTNPSDFETGQFVPFIRALSQNGYQPWGPQTEVIEADNFRALFSGLQRGDELIFLERANIRPRHLIITRIEDNEFTSLELTPAGEVLARYATSQVLVDLIDGRSLYRKPAVEGAPAFLCRLSFCHRPPVRAKTLFNALGFEEIPLPPEATRKVTSQLFYSLKRGDRLAWMDGSGAFRFEQLEALLTDNLEWRRTDGGFYVLQPSDRIFVQRADGVRIEVEQPRDPNQTESFISAHEGVRALTLEALNNEIGRRPLFIRRAPN